MSDKISSNELRPMPTSSVVWRSYRITLLFVSILVELFWHSLILRNQPPDIAQTRLDRLYRRQALRFRHAAEEMGGLLIKVGQFLSSRVDLLPQPYLEELAKLQDNVRPAPWADIRPVLNDELGGLTQHFVWFADIPVAAASLGQVYEAVLHDGRRVAVKVQRPGIDHIVEADLRALHWVVGLATRFTKFGRTFDLGTVLREFRRIVFEELDYRRELDNTELIRQDLGTNPRIIVPRTYPDLSTGRVLVMEFYRGIKIDHVQTLKESGIEPAQVAEAVIRLYLHMVLESGVYHADPHAGNILVDSEGRLILLDYGMVASLDIATKRNIRRLFVAVSGRDPGAVVNAMAALGMIRPGADYSQLRRRVSYLLDRYYAETLDQLGQLDIPQLLRDFEDILRDDAIQVPGHFAFLGRAIAILVGLATVIYPDINLVELFTPYARRFVTEDDGGTVGFVSRQAQKYARTMMELPLLSSKVLHALGQGDIETKIQWPQGIRDIRQLHRSIAGLSQALYVVGFSIAGILALSAHPWIGRILLALSLLTFMGGWVSRRHR